MRGTLTGCLVVALLIAWVPTAFAATVTRSNTDSLVYEEGRGGEVNALTVSEEAGDYVFTDIVPITPGNDCVQGLTPNVARCRMDNQYSVTVGLGAGDDQLRIDRVQYVGFFINGGSGEDLLRGAESEFPIDTRASFTRIVGGPGTDTYVNGAGFDYIDYSDKPAGVEASIDGAPNDPDGENIPVGVEALIGSDFDDTLTGSVRRDLLFGDGGKDTVDGVDGDDELTGGPGDDLLRGGSGTDTLVGDDGADRVEGGDGFDRYLAIYNDRLPGPGRTVRVSLNDVADDGTDGEGDDVRTDVENLSTFVYRAMGQAVFVGDADVNILNGGPAGDVLDGAGGGDFVNGGAGDDTVNARDGFATASTAARARHGRRRPARRGHPVRDGHPRGRSRPGGRGTPSPPPADDRPPTVAFTSPGEDALLEATGSTVTVDAKDDGGVTSVLLVDDGRVVGTDTARPYTFTYRPAGDDVGRNTLVAIAVDGAEQTGSAVRPVRVDRFLPTVRAAAAPARDRSAPYRFRITGGIGVPRTVTPADGCKDGFVAVQIKRGTRTISTRRAAITRRCTFASSITFSDRRRLGTGRLKATVRFLGNDVLRPRTVRPFALRAG
jgi:hypothetical protein